MRQTATTASDGDWLDMVVGGQEAFVAVYMLYTGTALRNEHDEWNPS